jgi:hypothetical protein
MRWAAMFVMLGLQGVAPAVLGMALVVAGLSDHSWQVIAIGIVLAVTMGWMSVDMLRTAGENQAAEEFLIRESLREALVG